MTRSLQRIRRIRHLAEEQSRLELERETQRLRQGQAARMDASARVHLQREQLAGSFVVGAESPEATHRSLYKDHATYQDQDWLLAEAALEFSSWNQMQLEQWCVQEAERVAPLAAQYQIHRRELRQVEQLLENQTEAERVVQERRDQSEADSWFQIETSRQKRSLRASSLDPRKK